MTFYFEHPQFKLRAQVRFNILHLLYTLMGFSRALQVVCRFRRGGFNTLVSTCVGEEGLDIGEVDLIVCFDAQKNPTRLVQRMGRTGRKRRGRIVVILAEGREERASV